jgi:hydroxypyruvate reductase
MAQAAVTQLGGELVDGLVIGPAASQLDSRLRQIVSGHPIPTTASEEAGRAALALAQSLPADDELLILLSGGSSALMAVPAEGLTLDDKQKTTSALLRAGADIHALNTVRKHLSAIKGGQLAAATRATVTLLAVSDVVGDDLGVIGSGPAVADGSRFADALEILRRYGGERMFPQRVVQRLTKGAAGDVPETPKPGDPRLARTHAEVIGSRRDAMDGATTEASSRGYRVIRIDDAIVGEARRVAASHLRAVLALARGLGRPLCVVSSGETTVHVTGSGRGGRNQEFVLAAAELLNQTGSSIAIASAGTDGVDGPTDAAGAYADATTIDRALAIGMRPDQYLNENNSYPFFEALGDLIHTGPTRTNVGDLQVLLLA